MKSKSKHWTKRPPTSQTMEDALENMRQISMKAYQVQRAIEDYLGGDEDAR